MAARRKRWTKILPTITLTAIPFTVNLPVASAFFPPVVPPPPVVRPPVVPPPVIVVPPVIPPPFVPPPPPPVVVPPVPPPPVVPGCPCPPPPNCVPEPMTILSGLFGLAALAGYNAVRRKDEQPGEKADDSNPTA